MRERPFCPRGWLRLYKSGSMRSSLDTETNREREGGGKGIRIPNWLPGQSSKLAQIWVLSRGNVGDVFADRCRPRGSTSPVLPHA